MLIDAHAHLDVYGEELAEALAEIDDHRILTISNSMDVDAFTRNLEIARSCPWVVPAFGIHPWRAPDYADRLDELGAHVERSLLLGEIGLDHRFVEDPALYPLQEQVFEFLLAAAVETDRSVSLHTSGAESRILSYLDRYPVRRVIVHWYSGPLDVLDGLIRRGAYLTVGVELLRSDHIREVARRIPEAQLLTETDNPGGQEWLTGNRGMPSLLHEVIEALAALRGVEPEHVVSLVAANFRRFVEEDPRLRPALAEVLARAEDV